MHTRILSVFFLALIVACGGGGSSSPAPSKEPTSEPPPPDPEPTVKLVPGGSAEQFAAFLKEGLAQWSGVGSESQSEAIQVMTQAMSNSDDADLIAEFNSANAPQPSPSVAADAAPDINVQVSGVDEADRARFTGQTLYVAERLEIRVLPTSDDGSSTRLADTLRLDYPNGEIQGLYLHMGGQSADQLVSITSEYPRYWGHAYGEPWQWRGGVTHLDLFNIDDQEQPVKREQITLEGYLMTTRRIDNMLYLVTRFTPELKGLVTPAVTDEEKETNTGLIEAVSVEDLLPMLSGKNAAGMDLTPVHLVNADACFVPELNNQNVWHPSIVTVTAINLEDTTEFQSVCMADEVSGYYVSPEALYLTSGRYGDVIALAEPVPADPAFAPEPPQDSTVIHKFNLTNQGPAYAGSGDVTGTFSGGDPAYRMGEHQGFLTIVTSESWGQNHRLTVLGESTSEDYLLEEMGHIPNDTAPATIGKPGEQIYSSRIIGDRAYIVTYQTIDPVYVIDLSTPGSPTILGELEIPGYSSYLHPVSDDYLLGIGKDTIVENGMAWFQGLNIRLFDITDPQNPRSVSEMVLGGRGSESPALYDPHAFMFSGSLDNGDFRFGIPVDLHEKMGNHGPSHHHPWSRSGLHLFELGSGNNPGIMPAGVIDSGLESSCWSELSRGFMHDDNVYFLYAGAMISASWQQPQLGHMTPLRKDRPCDYFVIN